MGLLAETLSGYMVFELSIWSYYLLIPIMLAGVPVLYLYILSLTTENFRFRNIYFIHFLPSGLILMINFIFLTIASSVEVHLLVEGKLSADKISTVLQWYIQTYKFSQFFLYNLQIVFYSILIILRLKFHQKNIKNYFSFTEKISLQWLKLYVIIFVVFSLTEIITTFFDFKRFNPEVYSIISFLFISYFGFAAFGQPDIFYNQEKLANSSINESKIVEVSAKDTVIIESVDQSRKPLPNSGEIGASLNGLMVSKKLYINADLTLEDLADLMGIHRNILSKVINDHYKMNFFNFVNNYRIEEAIMMFKNPEFSNLSIEGIAKTVGFNSKSVFNPAFKKQTGETPSEFRKKFLKS